MENRPTYGYGADDPDPAERPRPSYGYSADDAERAGGADGAAAGVGGSSAGAPGDASLPAHQIPGGDQAGAPVCPRHPDRVSYVRCKRCGRPACGECQRPAPVGMLCVDCEKELAAQQRSASPRNMAGGRMGSSTPFLTYGVIGLCVVLFLGQTLIPGGAVEQALIYAPVRTLAMPWTLITTGFLHGGVFHLLLNMYAMYLVGTHLERTLGHWRFGAIFMLSLFAGQVAVLLFADPANPSSWVGATLGASGGIFGLFGTLLIVNRRMGAETTQILVLIGLNLVITFTIPNISWQGHLGGLVMGTALTAVMFALRPKASPGADRAALARRSALIHGGVLAAGLVLCLVLIAVKIATVPAGYLPLL
ncbi:rhomboid family intramembrane serine protease [Brachybacterium halotolerans subsp. kimchii]|uniref:rhomboid family intramembrane serine protease n=1 Tax=Brachybacterium halotolerans TaxID=2795215 RepID=UPI001E3EBD8B|nr:rhomboid family intramembrane serine protease [Brachybacterium halotolerans]UEJ81666.1 rhomboid family intramembrane serine protease [Brachybacterium halotolerans subsp. kimchii]